MIDSPWWERTSNQELSYILFHLLGEASNRNDFIVTEQLKTRLLSIATESYKTIPTGESNE